MTGPIRWWPCVGLVILGVRPLVEKGDHSMATNRRDFILGFTAGLAPRPRLRRIRVAGEQLGEAALGVCRLLDSAALAPRRTTLRDP